MVVDIELEPRYSNIYKHKRTETKDNTLPKYLQIKATASTPDFRIKGRNKPSECLFSSPEPERQRRFTLVIRDGHDRVKYCRNSRYLTAWTPEQWACPNDAAATAHSAHRPIETFQRVFRDNWDSNSIYWY